jgi:osmotically-inducible protein OsmY
MRRRHSGRRRARPETEEPKLDYGPGHTLDSSRSGMYRRSWEINQQEKIPSPRTYRRSGFAGRGPKTYIRTDERIYEDINERLTLARAIDATDIEVAVNSGKVVLEGFVATRTMKQLAETLAKRTLGVKSVVNQLRIQRRLAA